MRIQNNKNNDSTKLQYTGEDSKLVLTVGKKEFNHSDHQAVFLNPAEAWVIKLINIYVFVDFYQSQNEFKYIVIFL